MPESRYHAELELQQCRHAIPDPLIKMVQKALQGDLHEEWTAFRKAKFLKEYRAHLKFTPEIRKLLRRVKPKASTWHVYYVLRDWCPTPEDQASKDCPRGLASLRRRIRRLELGVRVKKFGFKVRHQAAWKFGQYLTWDEVNKLLDCPPIRKKKYLV